MPIFAPSSGGSFDSITDAVAGPASAADNAIARFDGTTGKLIQSHNNTTLSDAGALYLSGADSWFQYEAYAASMFIEHALNEARLRWMWSDGVSAYNEFALKLDTMEGSQGLDSSLAYWLPQTEPGGTGEVLSVASIDSNGDYHLGWTAAGNGDVSGPASSTNNYIAQFNGTTGKLLKQSSLTALLDTLTGGTTQGAIMVRDAAGWYALGPGTAGHVLQSGGAGANPSWVANSAAVTPPSYVSKTDTASTTSSSYVDIADMSITYAAASTTQTITLRAVLMVGGSTTGDAQFIFENNDGVCLQAGSAGSRIQAHGYVYPSSGNVIFPLTIEVVFTPGTTAPRTYRVRWRRTGSGTIYLNRSSTDTDSASFTRAASTFILQPN